MIAALCPRFLFLVFVGAMGFVSFSRAELERVHLQEAKLHPEISPELSRIAIQADGKNYEVTPAFLIPAASETLSSGEVQAALQEALAEPFQVLLPVASSAQVVPAYIITASGSDLAEILVGRGLAKIVVDLELPDSPAGLTAGQTISRLKLLEQQARGSQTGRWAVPGERGRYVQAKDGQDFFPATRKDALKKMAGKHIRVRGKISRIGKTPSGHITFLNFEGAHRGGFSGIIRREDIPAAAGGGKNFPDNLVGKLVEISGPVALYNDSPQIEITTPGQIVILR